MRDEKYNEDWYDDDRYDADRYDDRYDEDQYDEDRYDEDWFDDDGYGEDSYEDDRYDDDRNAGRAGRIGRAGRTGRKTSEAAARRAEHERAVRQAEQERAARQAESRGRSSARNGAASGARSGARGGVRSGSRRRKPGAELLFWPVLLVLVCIFLWSGYHFFREFLTYREAEEEYEKLGELIVVRKEEPAAEKEEDAEETASRDEEWPALSLDIDYDGLLAKNADFTGVLYIPTLGLTYPVAHSRDNEEYLARTFEGTYNPSGCIFLDANASGDLTDLNSIIYGHNMKNGTMFGSLKKFQKDEELCADHPYFYICTKDRILRYEIFSYHTIPADDPIYTTVISAQNYDALVKKAISLSEFKGRREDIDFSAQAPIVTLSTCWGSGHTHNFVVYGVLDGEYRPEDGAVQETAGEPAGEET